jgi:UDP-3-O-[3-hydroxymyristoyl] glucosamine N-acyltransferase LpxD
MILQKIFLKMKSPRIADSWFMHTTVVQVSMKYCLKLFNGIAPKLPLFRQVTRGSIGEGTTIHPTAIIDYNDMIIGKSCIIEANVVIEKNTIIGNQVTISEGSVIGSEGFEVRRLAGETIRVAHLGGVIIHDNVFLGSHVCVDKSSLGEYTEIGNFSVIMSGVQIGHGIHIGQHVTISEGAMIGGYARIGNYVKIGKHCSIADGISLDDYTDVLDFSVVTRTVKRPSGNIPPIL